MIPVNQSYKVEATLSERPELARIKGEYESWIASATNFPNAGRSYDFAIAMYAVDFTGKEICELGARGSFLPSYLTSSARSVHASDLFEGWGELGNEDAWRERWTQNATDPQRLTVSTRDMRKTGYEDDCFDVVMSFSAIEHIRGDGDIEAAGEMGRICRPGGHVVIGTDMAGADRVQAGHYYDEASLLKRIIEPTGCVMDGPCDLSWATADKHVHKSGQFDRSACIFVLRKPS